MKRWIYLAAVTPDPLAQDAIGGPVPVVSTPLGPYEPDEADALARGRAWLEDVYGTEDIRDYVAEDKLSPEHAQARILDKARRDLWSVDV
jgi:hypothetical protein